MNNKWYVLIGIGAIIIGAVAYAYWELNKIFPLEINDRDLF